MAVNLFFFKKKEQLLKDLKFVRHHLTYTSTDLKFKDRNLALQFQNLDKFVVYWELPP
jgi:hypothetical protein